MHDRYLQHVFLCTTKAGSFECSSFVRRKPAAPSKSMAVWGIIVVRGDGVRRTFRWLGCWVTWVLRPCCARSGAAALLAAGECATMRAQAVLMTACRTALADAVFFYGLLSQSRRAAVRERSGGGSEAVERRPVDRSAEDESRSSLLVQDASRLLGSQHKNVLTQPLPHQSATGIEI